MDIKLATGGILAWIGRLISERIAQPRGVPRGAVILMLALGCWLALALVFWLAVAVIRAI